MDTISMELTREELGCLAEAVEELMGKKSGGRRRRLMQLRNRLCIEIAAAREEEMVRDAGGVHPDAHN